jgi:hypothetical protein
MIEAVAAFLALLGAGIFVAHAVDAYAHVAKANETVRNRDEQHRRSNSRQQKAPENVMHSKVFSGYWDRI